MVDFWEGEVRDIAPSNLLTPEVQAVSYAVREAMRRLQEWSASLPLYAEICRVPDPVLDLMATELNTQYYDQGLPRRMKERLVSQTLKWHMRGGTCLTLEEYLSTLYAGGRIEEWHIYGGNPYCFKAVVTVGEDERIEFGEGVAVRKRIMAYKNVRSWLDALIFRLYFYYKVSVKHGAGVTIRAGYYPRYNLAFLYLDGIWRLDGERGLNGYDSGGPIDFYPCHMGILTQVAGKVENAWKARMWMGAESLVAAGAAAAFQAAARIFTEEGEDIPLCMDGSVPMDGGVDMSGYLERKRQTIPEARVHLAVGTGIPVRHGASMTEERNIGYLDGNWKLDGGRKLDAQLIHHLL